MHTVVEQLEEEDGGRSERKKGPPLNYEDIEKDNTNRGKRRRGQGGLGEKEEGRCIQVAEQLRPG